MHTSHTRTVTRANAPNSVVGKTTSTTSTKNAFASISVGESRAHDKHNTVVNVHSKDLSRRNSVNETGRHQRQRGPQALLPSSETYLKHYNTKSQTTKNDHRPLPQLSSLDRTSTANSNIPQPSRLLNRSNSCSLRPPSTGSKSIPSTSLSTATVTTTPTLVATGGKIRPPLIKIESQELLPTRRPPLNYRRSSSSSSIHTQNSSGSGNNRSTRNPESRPTSPRPAIPSRPTTPSKLTTIPKPPTPSTTPTPPATPATPTSPLSTTKVAPKSILKKTRPVVWSPSAASRHHNDPGLRVQLHVLERQKQLLQMQIQSQMKQIYHHQEQARLHPRQQQQQQQLQQHLQQNLQQNRVLRQNSQSSSQLSHRPSLKIQMPTRAPSRAARPLPTPPPTKNVSWATHNEVIEIENIDDLIEMGYYDDYDCELGWDYRDESLDEENGYHPFSDGSSEEEQAEREEVNEDENESNNNGEAEVEKQRAEMVESYAPRVRQPINYDDLIRSPLPQAQQLEFQQHATPPPLPRLTPASQAQRQQQAYADDESEAGSVASTAMDDESVVAEDDLIQRFQMDALFSGIATPDLVERLQLLTHSDEASKDKGLSRHSSNTSTGSSASNTSSVGRGSISSVSSRSSYSSMGSINSSITSGSSRRSERPLPPLPIQALFKPPSPTPPAPSSRVSRRPSISLVPIKEPVPQPRLKSPPPPPLAVNDMWSQMLERPLHQRQSLSSIASFLSSGPDSPAPSERSDKSRLDSPVPEKLSSSMSALEKSRTNSPAPSTSSEKSKKSYSLLSEAKGWARLKQHLVSPKLDRKETQTEATERKRGLGVFSRRSRLQPDSANTSMTSESSRTTGEDAALSSERNGPSLRRSNTATTVSSYGSSKSSSSTVSAAKSSSGTDTWPRHGRRCAADSEQSSSPLRKETTSATFAV
ncbi:hypothetical protein BCR41DRAFT_344965 [Lobosporangium transversale]|uniref:Uncharacterized protein n=1 Tax=Lobosporangium transversale TaxID=64571 RepID=A0A1Y2H146_9FUNG|nr:hypothetical protein BCR41DRAFT_344965 [Lobosporangium transversale]ORZ28277.1 hypothetical protein BCR41DRAFT_344965 [Lobosporangium transversale]|eukprot:XP_021885962.1 hypothetical protein BCR41DRAFT_344965 [Lobosporangium transversale]